MRRWVQILVIMAAVVLADVSAAGEMALVSASSADAAEQTEKPESEMTEAEKAEKEAKEAYEKKLQETYKMPVQTNELKGWPEGPGTYGEAAIVMDADSGAILYGKNIDQKEYPASITKVLTALVAFQYGSMDSQVAISQEALSCLGSGYASIGLKAGNVISMEQAMYAMLLASANEAAYAVGETVASQQGQGYEWFVEQMNQTCARLGGVNSNFVNTNGVFEEDHYTCARDMALIGKALFDYPLFFQICQTQEYKIPQSADVEEHVFQQKHHMLISGNEDYYEYAIGGKTGYTTEAENTLITMADNGERRLICVVLKTYGGHPYSDTKALLDYGFGHFQKVSVAENTEDENFDVTEEGAYVLLPEKVDFEDLDRTIEFYEDGTNRALLIYYYDDMPVGSCDVMVRDGYEKDVVEVKEAKAPKEEPSEREWFKAAAAVAAAAILLICGVITMIVTRLSRKRRRHRRRH